MQIQSLYEKIGNNEIEVKSDSEGNITHTNYFETDIAQKQFIRLYPFQNKIRALIPSTLCKTVLKETKKANAIELIKQGDNIIIVFNDSKTHPYAISTSTAQWEGSGYRDLCNIFEIYSDTGKQKTYKILN